MARMEWGQGPPMYDLGLDHGVLYLGGIGVPWNGLVSVTELDSGSLNVEHYFDGVRTNVSEDVGDFGARISAYTYPDAFAEYNGYSERNIYERFGLSYRTQYGEEEILHLVYNVLVRDDSRSWQSLGSSVDPSLFNWDISATAVEVPGAEPAAHLSMMVPRNSEVFSTLEGILYGTDTTDPRLPDPAEIIELYEAATSLRITYNGDGSYTAEGPDDMVQLLDDGLFELTAPTVFLIDKDIFTVNSY